MTRKDRQRTAGSSRELLKPQAAPEVKTNTSSTGESPSDIMKRPGNRDDSADAARAAEAQEFHRQAVIDRAAQAAADSDDDTVRQRIALRLLQKEPAGESGEPDEPSRYTNYRPMSRWDARSGRSKSSPCSMVTPGGKRDGSNQ